MPRNWKKIAETDGIYAEEDFQQASYKLMTEQVIYERFPLQRRSYDIITRYLSDFVEAFALFGCRVEKNIDYSYVYAQFDFPRSGTLKLDESLLALTLRKLYHQAMLECRSQRGVVEIELDELRVCFEDTTKRPFPEQASVLKDWIAPLKRFGLARIESAPVTSPQPFFIQILPAIADLISESVLARIIAEASVDSSALSGDNEIHSDDNFKD